MTYVVTEACVDVLDKSCIEECPVDCLYEGARMMYINPKQCIDCGACESVCPVEAIYYAEDMEPEHEVYAESAVDFFAALSSPKGGTKSGKIQFDSEYVAKLASKGSS